MRKLVFTAMLALLPPAVHAQAKTAKADTVKLGKYDLEVLMESGTLLGELTVNRDTKGYVATISVGAMKPDVQSFKREGGNYVLKAGNSEHSIVYTFTFAKDSVKGSFQLGGGMTGTLVGLFKP